jgi:hypothetical protein
MAAPVATPSLSAEECAVWQREQSFAGALAAHDATAFAGHVGVNAAFGAGTPEPTRGRDAIVKRWAGLLEGKHVALRWYPTRVTMAAGVDAIAWSSGPALFEVLDPQGQGPLPARRVPFRVAQGCRRRVARAVRRRRGTTPRDCRGGRRVQCRSRRMPQRQPQLTSG